MQMIKTAKNIGAVHTHTHTHTHTQDSYRINSTAKENYNLEEGKRAKVEQFVKMFNGIVVLLNVRNNNVKSNFANVKEINNGKTKTYENK